MILLLDLHERPFMPEAPKSRGFIDQVFAVFGEHGNYATCEGEGRSRPLMEGGREAWRMLWRLRKKAYEKAGIPVPETDEETDDPDPPAAAAATATATATAEQTPDPIGFTHYMSYPTTPPLPPQAAQPPPPPPPPSPPPPPGGFEELLHMDTIIDAEDKAFFTEEVAASFVRGISAAFPPPAEGLFGESETEPPLDMMDFDWEEWDQVFGKSVHVNDASGG